MHCKDGEGGSSYPSQHATGVTPNIDIKNEEPKVPPCSVSPLERGRRGRQEAAEEVESLSPIDGNVKMKGRGEEGMGRIL